MLIWANKNEVNTEMATAMETMYGKEFPLKDFKPWELSIILRQIQRHFGDRKDVSMLDFGAGASPFGAYLKHLNYHSITCLDMESGWHPEIDQETYNEKYNTCIEYIKVDVEKDSIGKYDVIFSASVLEHIKDRGMKALQSLSKSLKSNGLFIHVVDYHGGNGGNETNFKDLIDNCGVSISYKPEETPGCKEFKEPPEYAWLERGESRIAFFNEHGG